MWLGGDWQVSEALTGMERQFSDVLCQNSELSYCKPAPDVNAAHVLPPPRLKRLSHGMALLTRCSDIVLLLQPLR